MPKMLILFNLTQPKSHSNACLDSNLSPHKYDNFYQFENNQIHEKGGERGLILLGKGE